MRDAAVSGSAFRNAVSYGVLTTLLCLSPGPVTADTPPKIKFAFLLLPGTVKTGDTRTLTQCFVNTGLENSLIEDEGDELTLTIPVGEGAGDLADAFGIAGLACSAPAGWKCSVEDLDESQAVVAFGPDEEVTVAPESTICFDLTGTVVNSTEGVVFVQMDQSIASQRAENPANGVLSLFKSAEGVIEHDDLDGVTAHQHHQQSWAFNSPHIFNLNNGNVGIGTAVPVSDLEVRGELTLGDATTGDKISLFGHRLGDSNMYGFGVEDFALYYKSNRDHRWYSNDNADGGTSAKMILRFPNDSAELRLRDASATESVLIQTAHQAAGGMRGARMLMQNPGEQNTITLDADWNGTGEGRVITNVVQITGGSDLSEQFNIGGDPRPGMVVSIDPGEEGQLVVSTEAYDRRVAGIVSGANDVKPGMLMGQEGTVADGDHPVALSGRVYCRVDETADPILPGDLITTSATPGHCMKASDLSRAAGAVVGKAMSRSRDGMVLVLVSLQ